MSKIKQFTQSIRNYAGCELDYGTIRTLKMIDDEADRLETQLQNTSSNNKYTAPQATPKFCPRCPYQMIPSGDGYVCTKCGYCE